MNLTPPPGSVSTGMIGISYKNLNFPALCVHCIRVDCKTLSCRVTSSNNIYCDQKKLRPSHLCGCLGPCRESCAQSLGLSSSVAGSHKLELDPRRRVSPVSSRSKSESLTGNSTVFYEIAHHLRKRKKHTSGNQIHYSCMRHPRPQTG